MRWWWTSGAAASAGPPRRVRASIRRSLARRREVVRRRPPPIPPEQPRTLSRTLFSLFLVERRHAVPVGRRRVAAPFRYFFRIHLVELAGGIHALQIKQAYLDLIPLLRAVMPQRLVPQPQLA